jgi:hypothetical protein
MFGGQMFAEMLFGGVANFETGPIPPGATPPGSGGTTRYRHQLDEIFDVNEDDDIAIALALLESS